MAKYQLATDTGPVISVGKSPSPPAPKWDTIRAKYDSALTSPDNKRYWSLTDPLSADAALDPFVRETIRNRARYEVANNTYAKGLVLTIASDVIGTGPRIQMVNPPSPKIGNKMEAEFKDWMDEINLPSKLATMTSAKITDGEAFGVLFYNPKMEGPVKLDYALLEADRVCAKWSTINDPLNIDGVILDKYGNPVSYTYLTQHPGGNVTALSEWKTVGAQWMTHWFRADRPEQHRGVSEISSALPLFAQLRRYTLATVAAAETAADIASIIYTDMPMSGGAQAGAQPFEEIFLPKRMQMVLPEGWKMNQFKAEQPVTTYAEFKREVLGEIARCLQVPVNVITGDSSQHNYASGRLDHQVYHRAIYLYQKSCADFVLDKLYREWLREWLLATRKTAPAYTETRHIWFWDGFEHVDPEKEANAQAVRIANRTTTLANEYAKIGKDWEIELEQIARERAKMKELGLLEEDNDNGQ